MRFHPSAALRIGEVLLAGSALWSSGGCAPPPALITAAYGETAAIGTRGSAPPRDFVGELRLGHGLDMLGKVPPSLGASRFAVGDPIHLSLWEVTDAPEGSLVRVLVRDVTDQIVWSERKQAPRGGSYVSFNIGRALVRGKYRAELIIGHEVREQIGFDVFTAR